MSIEVLIMDTLRPMGYPIAPDIYDGKEKKYYTYNIADDRGLCFGDDEPLSNRLSVQVHFFLPMEENYIGLKRATRQRLFVAGFTYPIITMTTETDTRKRHIIFECEIEEEREEE